MIENDIIVEGVKVGTVDLCLERSEISRLVIFEPYQNKGYGTDIVRELVKQGYKSLWVRSDNPRAIHVYEKCGKWKCVNDDENIWMCSNCGNEISLEVGNPAEFEWLFCPYCGSYNGGEKNE